MLSVLANAASDKTYNELCQVVKFGDASQLGRMLDDLVVFRGDNSKEEFAVGNALFVAQGTQLNEDFKQAIQGENTRIQTVDFIGSLKDKSIQEINRWAADVTRGKITQILNPVNDYSDTKLLLSSAVYFRGAWMNKFKPSNYSGGFKAANGEQVQAKFMTQQRELKVGEIYSQKLRKDVARFIELPYSDNRFSMIVVLPYETENLSTVIDSIDIKEVINNAVQRGATHDVNVTMPKFEIRSSQSLVNPLSQMGLATIFSTSALFPYMIQARNAAVSDITQDAFISVDETGTQAGKSSTNKHFILTINS